MKVDLKNINKPSCYYNLDWLPTNYRLPRVIDQLTEDKEVTDTQAEFGPIAGNSRVPYNPPFASLERLVTELKVELGVQDADIM